MSGVEFATVGDIALEQVERDVAVAAVLDRLGGLLGEIVDRLEALEARRRPPFRVALISAEPSPELTAMSRRLDELDARVAGVRAVQRALDARVAAIEAGLKDGGSY